MEIVKKSAKEFISQIHTEIASLDKVSDITAEDPVLVAIEVKARKLSIEKLERIMEPLLEKNEVAFNNQDYTI